jgi:hypothetical protein
MLLCGLLVLAAGPAMARADEPPVQPEATEPVDVAALIRKEAAAAEGTAPAAGEAADSQSWAPPPKAPAAAAARRASPYKTMKVTEKGKQVYASEWGIVDLKVSYTSSGNLIRFSYRVKDPKRAAVLSDKKLTPYLLGIRSHALLSVPVMEKVGPLRQAMAPEAGQEYWMAFSNKGHLVKPGDRVNVMIGSFHADGLMVE